MRTKHIFDPWTMAKHVTIAHLSRMRETARRQVPTLLGEMDFNLWWLMHPAVELTLKPDMPLWNHGKHSELDPKGDSAYAIFGLPGRWIDDGEDTLGLVVLHTYNFRQYPYAVVLTYGLEMYIWERTS